MVGEAILRIVLEECQRGGEEPLSVLADLLIDASAEDRKALLRGLVGSHMSLFSGTRFLFDEKRERRWRLLRISPELLLNALVSPVRQQYQIRTVVCEGLPEGVEVAAVIWDEYCRSFVFRLWHSSFDIVPVGELIPYIEPRFRHEVINLPPEGVV